LRADVRPMPTEIQDPQVICAGPNQASSSNVFSSLSPQQSRLWSRISNSVAYHQDRLAPFAITPAPHPCSRCPRDFV
ncbi:hypothetical protein K438DRAFT_1811472, partial [Mycena galopus ATCC 62051]